MSTYEWITTFLVPVTGVVSWIAGTRMRRNDTIRAMQTTIDMLAEKNRQLYAENQELRREMADLRNDGIKRDSEINDLRLQIERLKK